MVTCYPPFGKRKAMDICQAFLAGCGGGEIVTDGRLRNGGPAFFYGIDGSNESIWKQVNETLCQYYYSDNSYFDSTRQTYFRITRNRIQHNGYGESDGARFRSLKIKIAPWRTHGDHIVVCPQSDDFMRRVVGLNDADSWLPETVASIRHMSSRPIRVRPWNRDKAAASATLPQDLVNAHAVVTWSSAAVITGLINGVPGVSIGQSAASPMTGLLSQLESLPMPDDRERWCGVLADAQFTLDEMRSGFAWASLQ